jgi:hypothetical protein
MEKFKESSGKRVIYEAQTIAHSSIIMKELVHGRNQVSVLCSITGCHIGD